jgi:hypothetical protein
MRNLLTLAEYFETLAHNSDADICNCGHRRDEHKNTGINLCMHKDWGYSHCGCYAFRLA